MENYLKIAAENTRRAEEIIAESRLEEIFRAEGIEPRRVGSLRMGLLMNHRDIDFHLYSSPLSLERSFTAMMHLAENSHVRRIYYTNLADTDEHCIEWHAVWVEPSGEEWTIDLIHILSGSTFDGWFEGVADAVVARLTPERRETILRLKFETPAAEHIMGVEYYRAVLDFGVSTFDEFTRWRKAHAADDLLGWRPK